MSWLHIATDSTAVKTFEFMLWPERTKTIDIIQNICKIPSPFIRRHIRYQFSRNTVKELEAMTTVTRVRASFHQTRRDDEQWANTSDRLHSEARE